MKPMDPRFIKRRDFLISSASLAGVGLPALGWAATPCPPAAFSVTGGTSTSKSCGSASGLPALTLTSAAASGTYPWTFGQAFRRGDVPSGSYITGDSNNFQADVRNRWSDGSVKFAVLSGVSTFAQNQAKVVSLSTTSSAPASANVAEPTSLDVSVTFSGSVAGICMLQSALGVDKESWSGKSTGGRVRKILGPVMSEFHYYVPTSDAHVAVWFYVRRYSNGATEVETVVENGWLLVASPGQKDYTVAVRIGGATVYGPATLSHLHHTRWSRVDWVGTDPAISPSHDAAYLRSTRLVPNYGYTNPSTSAWADLASAINPTPFARGNLPNVMGTTGYDQSIGLLPRWDALYCSSGHANAYRAVMSNARGAGRYALFYRNESTGRPLQYSQYRSGPSVPSAGGGAPPAWAVSHHPSVGYVAYLVSGRWPMLELCQFAPTRNFIDCNPEYRQYDKYVIHFNHGTFTTRGGAWSIRSLAQAATVSPEYLAGASPVAADAAIRNESIAALNNTFAWLRARYVDGTVDGGIHKNTVGWLGQYDGGDTSDGANWWGRSWMVDFQTGAIAFAYDLEPGNATADHIACRNHSFRHRVDMLGTEATWNFRRGVAYNRPYLKNMSPESPQFMSIAEAFAAYKSLNALTALSSNVGDALKDHTSERDLYVGSSSDVVYGYWANATPAIVYAVDAGFPGATTAWQRMTSAPNWSQADAGADDNPTWALVPR